MDKIELYKIRRVRKLKAKYFCKIGMLCFINEAHYDRVDSLGFRMWMVEIHFKKFLKECLKEVFK